MPAGLDQSRKTVEDAIPQITDMENQVSVALNGNIEPDDAPIFNVILNGIQQELEILQSNITFWNDRGGG